MNVKLVWITPKSQKIIAYCARVSNPLNQKNEKIEGLLKYCIKHGHWSVFEMASMCIEIKTSRAISSQILRHKSFSFQEFSQRYAQSTRTIEYQARRQDLKNRQNSYDDLDTETKTWFMLAQRLSTNYAMELYQKALDRGIAKECARFLLPMSTETTLYMTGNIRSWIHYCQLRCDPSTQLEHRELANKIKGILLQKLPVLKEILYE